MNINTYKEIEASQNSKKRSQRMTEDTLDQSSSDNQASSSKNMGEESPEILLDIQSESSDFSKPSIFEQAMADLPRKQVCEIKETPLSEISIFENQLTFFGIDLRENSKPIKKSRKNSFQSEQETHTAIRKNTKNLVLDHLEEISLEEILEICRKGCHGPKEQFLSIGF